jgi:hypothetical protein
MRRKMMEGHLLFYDKTHDDGMPGLTLKDQVNVAKATATAGRQLHQIHHRRRSKNAQSTTNDATLT